MAKPTKGKKICPSCGVSLGVRQIFCPKCDHRFDFKAKDSAQNIVHDTIIGTIEYLKNGCKDLPKPSEPPPTIEDLRDARDDKKKVAHYFALIDMYEGYEAVRKLSPNAKKLVQKYKKDFK